MPQKIFWSNAAKAQMRAISKEDAMRILHGLTRLMNIRAVKLAPLLLFVVIATAINSGGERPKPSFKFNLDSIKLDSGGCTSGWKRSDAVQLLSVSEKEVVISALYSCESSLPAATYRDEIVILDAQSGLHLKQLVECPLGKPPWPCAVLSQLAKPVKPSKGLEWQVSDSQRWYFDKKGLLKIIESDGHDYPVSTQWRSPAYSQCGGQLSLAESSRFLASCEGSHVYTDGMFDDLFGYNKIALFDVKSRNLLLRLDESMYTDAMLSASGKLVATCNGKIIKLYRID